jgi:hypothetical protein
MVPAKAGDGDAQPEDDVFPPIPPAASAGRSSRRLITFIAFGTIAVAVISAAVNVSLFPGGPWWFLFVLAGLASLWLSFLIINRQWWDIPKNIFSQVIVISIMVLLWDFFTGFHKWSLNFVVPILWSSSMVALAVLSKVRKLQIEDYLVYLSIISIISIFSLLLIIFKVVTTVYPAMLCFVISIISLAFLLLFEGKSLREELRRRMHL